MLTGALPGHRNDQDGKWANEEPRSARRSTCLGESRELRLLVELEPMGSGLMWAFRVTVLGFSYLYCGAGAFSVSNFSVCCEIESMQALEVIK